MATPSKPATLFLVGTPLREGSALAPEAISALTEADVLIGESRKLVDRYQKQLPPRSEPPRRLFCLDPLPRPQEKELMTLLEEGSRHGITVALFSDHGMPVLFDPGGEILSRCRKLGFNIRTAAGATSWGTACAASGLMPPFWLEGFLPQNSTERDHAWNRLKNTSAHRVLLETPYRFRKLLEEVTRHCGNAQPLYLAWELGLPTERHWWGTAAEILQRAEREGLEKGEFILILEGKRSQVPRRGDII